MFENLDHIGIAVKSFDDAGRVFESVLGVPSYLIEEVPSEGVSTMFFKVGNTKVELLVATEDNSPIKKFIEKRGEGVHHLAFGVKNIFEEKDRLIKEGFTAIGEVKDGAENMLVCFFHPKDTHGVLIELCQKKGE